ncbi:MAG: YfcE family phosphodiesterase [Anaerolineae bacterium]|nr:YfcE family phosphodiesterase [Anaerolineae bacterium]
MRCGLIADTHNNQANLKAALARLWCHQVECILHAGDITSIQTLELMADFNAWISQGNMDREPGLKRCARFLYGPGRFQSVHKIQLADKHIALMHSQSHPDWIPTLHSSNFQYMVYGHTHQKEDTMVGTTRVINPGSLSGTRYKPATCAILDLATDRLEWLRF